MNFSKRLNSLTGRWLMVSAGSVVRLALAFLVNVIVVRALGPAGYGVFATFGALAAIGSGFADFGLSDSAVRRSIIDPGNSTTARTFFWLRVVLAGGVALIGSVILIVIGWPAPPLPVALVAIGLVVTAIAGAFATMLQADNRFGLYATLPLINSGLSLALALALVATGSLTLVSVLVWLGIVPSVMAAVVAYRQIPPDQKPGTPLIDNVTTWVRESVWIGIANNLAVLSVSLDVVVIGALLGPVAAGMYGLALGLAGKADVLSGSLYSVLLPAAARRDGMHARAHLVRGGVAVAFIVAGSFAAGPFIGIVYGPDYRDAAVLVVWLVAAVGLDILVAPLQPIAIAAGRTRLLAVAEGARCLVVVGSLFLLIPAIGPVGAALARILGRLIYIAAIAYPAISSYREANTEAAGSRV